MNRRSMRTTIYVVIAALAILFLIFGDRIGPKGCSSNAQSALACTNHNHVGGAVPGPPLPVVGSLPPTNGGPTVIPPVQLTPFRSSEAGPGDPTMGRG